MGWILIGGIIVLGIWILLEMTVRIIAEKGLKADFYGSITRESVRELQIRFGVKMVDGPGWYHLGWVADPERERYVIQTRWGEGRWMTAGKAKYGSWLAAYSGETGDVRVVAISLSSEERSVIGELPSWTIPEAKEEKYLLTPRISGKWHPFFKPEIAGDYINDHCLYRDKQGNWRLLGITAAGQGDYDTEKWFAVGYGKHFPPQEGFSEDAPIADFGAPAWAPDVVQQQDKYHLFWSPHKLHHMESEDGVVWENHEIIMDPAFHKFFRDTMVIQVGPEQWLMYATSRGKWFSRVDLYQSFDLKHWQYIRPALRGFWGSEKNFVTGSMESPFLIRNGADYYLSITYNNESFFWSAVLLTLKVFLRKRDYNHTLIFHSRTPYDFGVYNGRKHSQHYLTRLEAHAPIYVENEGEWYITTCGWPFAATLTDGSVAWAHLVWEDSGQEKSNPPSHSR
jgi:beta-fructofuranosidase